MAQDEGRVARISRPKRMPGPHQASDLMHRLKWCESPSMSPAAVAPSLGLMTSLVLPAANTTMMNLFLSQVSQTLADYFIVMQVDQAGAHSIQ